MRSIHLEELRRRVRAYEAVRGPAFTEAQWKVHTDAAVMVADSLLAVWPLSGAEQATNREFLEAHAKKLNELAREFRESLDQ